MEDGHPDTKSSTTQVAVPTELPTPTAAVPTSIPPSPLKPILKPESPSIKRKPTTDSEQSSASRNDQLAVKRVRSAPAAVKILPVKYEECAIEDLVVLIASMIAELVETNDALPPRPNPVLTRFHSRTPPGISVLDYLQRLAKHATLSPPLLLSMVYYIDRLCALYPDFTITSLTIHRFLITAATVAAKGLSDSFWNNSTYARVGGIKIAELGLLELEFLYRVDWKIVPNPEVLVDYYKGLIDRTEGFKLEGDSSSEEEDDGIEDEDSDMVDSPPDGAPGTETAARWQAWMDENKSASSGKPIKDEEGLSPEYGQGSASEQKAEDDGASKTTQ
ncbi:Phosphatase regulation [Hyphodiscus hymeniophilus]|uniref:Phosphatase regulation n=1 Tax=Hyphodiscus hymeniophilus TaxID=353542 RepID=A0A9P6VH28_9HELO|nr:Phosphatase regulation [Hyphodiscus hymeniophilus]